MSLTRGAGPLASKPPTTTNYHIEAPAHRLLFHPFPRRVRGLLGDRVVLDTRRGMFLHESNLLPQLYVPTDDLDSALLTPTDHRTHCPFKGDASYWSLTAGDRAAENAVWAYPTPTADADWLRGYVAVYWYSLDAWYDEDEEVFGHLRDPYHRVDVRRTSSHVRVTIDGEQVADTRRAVVLSETGFPNRYYIPPEDVQQELTLSATHTHCPYKGTATYRGASGRSDVAWSYREPFDGVQPIRDHVCFAGDGVTTWADEEPVDTALYHRIRP